MDTILDMPKIESPFVRVQTAAGYVVTPQVTEGYEWVFTDDAVLATEKLDGTNVSVVIEEGRIRSVWNRTNRVDPWEGNAAICEAIRDAVQRGRVPHTDGQHFGEVVGPRVQKNPYSLSKHEWVPFQTYACRKLQYRSWGEYPRTFEVISAWFRDDIFSLFFASRNGGMKMPPEGIVFHHADGRMAKLRRDMFDWYRSARHKAGA